MCLVFRSNLLDKCLDAVFYARARNTLAVSVIKRCIRMGLVASSVDFHRGFMGRRCPEIQKLVNAVMRDLGHLDGRVLGIVQGRLMAQKLAVEQED